MTEENAATINEVLNNNNKTNKVKDFNENADIFIITTEKSSSNNLEDVANLKRKIEHITQYLKPYISKILYEVLQINSNNLKDICDYIVAEQNELNIKESTKETKIKKLVHLSRYFHHKKTFYEMTKEDILDYLNNLRESSIANPTHKSIGTWNSRQMLFLKFFRWLYNRNEPDIRKRETPGCMKSIRQLPRKEKSPYKPDDMWTMEEHSLFLKYCPYPRDRCYHAMACDTSARPHELLSLKIKDIKFKVSSDSIQYAEVTVDGKTGPRTLPLIDSIPYLKEWILNHPNGNNPDSWLFVSLSDKNYGSNNNDNFTLSNQLSVNGLLKRYKNQYFNLFRKLSDDKKVPEVDKAYIKNFITKPWNLYIIRHSALTEKSKIIKEHILRNHAGWSITSKMPQRYIHYFGSESSILILKVRGVIKENETGSQNILKSKQCPNCFEPNKQDNMFCPKCKMILSYDSYNEVRNKDKQKMDRLESDIESLKSGMTKIFLLIQQNPALVNVKPEVLEKMIK